MKKLLLSMIVTMLTFVGAWGQATHTVYKFKAASDGSLFTDAEGQNVATYAAGDVCDKTYYLKVDYQPTTPPATKSGPSLFKVTDYYVNNSGSYSCAFGQEYNESNSYATVATTIQITDANKDEYVQEAYTFTENGANSICHSDGSSKGSPVVVGEVLDVNAYYYVYGGVQKGEVFTSGYNGMTVKGTSFKSPKDIYTLTDGIYTQISTPAYDLAKTYYVVTFEVAETSAVTNPENFSTSLLVDLSAETRTLYYKNGTSFVQVEDGDVYLGDDAYYVSGTSYQPCTPEQLATLGYVTGTVTLYDCDVVKTADQITISYHNYGKNNFLNYFTDCVDEISNHTNVVVKSTDSNHGSASAVSTIISGLNNASGITNLILEEVNNVSNSEDYDLRGLTNSDLKRIILPTKTEYTQGFPSITTLINKVAGKNSTVNPVVIEVLAQYNGEYRCFILSPAAGSLAAIKDAHYYSAGLNSAIRQVYYGEIDHTDVAWFNEVKVSQLDLSAFTHQHDSNDNELTEIKEALHELTNNNIEYVVFPDLEIKPVDPYYTDFLHNCPNVIAIGQYTTVDKTLTALSKEAGKIGIITDMLSDLTSTNTKIENAKISGTLNAEDLNGGAHVIDANGHFTTSGGTGKGALIAAQLHSLDLEGANFYDDATNTEHYEDMTLSAFGILSAEPSYRQYVTLPKSEKVTIIPEGCLSTLKKLENICIPYNIKEIHASAFEYAGIHHITCTDALGDTIDYGDYTFALPGQLKLIKTHAFNVGAPQDIHDIYVLARIAPKCESLSFSTKNTWGDGGFGGNNAHPINRNNYKNGVNLISILHFPAGISIEEKKHYMDITRKYSLSDETGATNDDGELWMWPHHGQLYRSFDQAIAGVTWDAWTPSRDANDWGTTENRWDPSTCKDTKSKAQALAVGHVVDASLTYDYDYVGWHEFVLTGATNYNVDPDDDPKSYWNFSKFKKCDWYTLCVPFNMTKDDLARVFGAKEHEAIYYTEKEIANAVPGDDAYGKTTADVRVPAVTETAYPDVITLAGATRNVNNLHIQIQLSDNLVNKKLVTDAETGLVTVTNKDGKYVPVYETRTGGDDEIIIEANKPYFVRPYLPESEIALANAGKRAVAYNPIISTETQVPYAKHHVNVLDGDQTKFLDWQDKGYESVPAKPYKYYFVGSYLMQDMPMYAYYLGSKGGKSTLFRNTNGKSWSEYTTVIGGVASDKASVVITGGEEAGKDLANYKVVFTAEEDFTFEQSLPTQQNARSFSYSIVEDEGNVTGIMIPNADGSVTFVKDNSKIYNVNGQYVGTSVNNLGKGLYIANGKKIVVK